MSIIACSKNYPPVPQNYICKACNSIASHWIFACEQLEDYTYKNSKYAVDYDHVKVSIKDISDCIDIDDEKAEKDNNNNDEATSYKLLSIFDKISVTNDELSLWSDYGGYSEIFNDKSDAYSGLESVIEFAENNESCSKHIKQKLRVITKLIMEKGIKLSKEYIHILLLLSSHGNVCNVMKEVAIGNAYGLMTDKLTDFIQSQSLKQQIYKVLRDYRILLVERLFHKFEMTNNTHYIAGFHNELAEKIGIEPYNDPDICTPHTSKCKQWRKNLDQRYYKTMYNKENIIKHVLTQIYEKKIGYQYVVQYFQDNCPKDMNRIEFLTKAIDIDTGKINQDYICWLLERFGVFKIKDNDWKPIQKCWNDIV